LSGSELVPNGDFPSGLTDGDVGYDNGDGTVDGYLNQNSATASVVGGELEVVWNASNSQVRYYLTGLSDGTYVVSVDAYRGTADSYDIRIGDNVATTTYGAALTQTNTASTTHVFYANVSNGFLSIFLRVNSFTVGDTAYFDNISVRLADPDRSVKGNGLGVYGSITKAAVATGADLVAYSGFNGVAGNYLEQPYNADLDFGTNDFSVMGWGKSSATSSSTYISYGTTGGIWQLQHDGSGTLNGYLSGLKVTHANINDGSWKYIAMVRSSGTVYLYVNGSLVDSASAGANVTTADATVRLGLRQGDINAFGSGSLALWRISATAPTAEQIAKIYNDEKVLFQPNAKATLTGSSDAVTALAHDPDTNLLHVGTSGGRSVFYGLRRVNETATAVTTAISAVDGLIVEQ